MSFQGKRSYTQNAERNISILALSRAEVRHGWHPGTALLSVPGRDPTTNPLEPHPPSQLSE